MGRPRRNNRSTAAATTIASTKTSGTTTKTKLSINEIQHHINDKDDADSTVFTTTTTMMNDADENNDELRIYNEQIRYSEAIEFLQLQKERLERLEIYCSNQMKKKNNITTITTTTKSDPNYHIQLTRGMLYTLQQLQTESCTCLLCHGIFIQPITLVSCTHTFCKSCIHQHTDHSWYCPIPSCKLPVSMKQQDRKFWNVNAVTQTVVTSWANICHTLMKADDHWWKIPNSAAGTPTKVVQSNSFATEQQARDDDDDDDEYNNIPTTVRKKNPTASTTTAKRNNLTSSKNITAATGSKKKKSRPSPTPVTGVTLGQPEATTTTEENENEDDDDELEDNKDDDATPTMEGDDDPSITVMMSCTNENGVNQDEASDNDSVSLF